VNMKIADEHRTLDRLFAMALKRLEEGAPDLAIADAVEDLRGAMESHLAAEENLYFPTIWALLPDFKGRLRAFIRAHQHFRGLLQEITGLTVSEVSSRKSRDSRSAVNKRRRRMCSRNSNTSSEGTRAGRKMRFAHSIRKS